MAYLLTNASDTRNLLSVIKTFATGTPGWTSVYDAISGSGQLGISKGNCKLAIGEQLSPTQNPVVRDDLVNGGTVNDAYLHMCVNDSLNAGNQQFWGHPGSIVTTSTDPDRVSLNDVYGTFTNVWLFSSAGGTYIWCVTQQGGDRFNVFGFGVLDKRGMTHPDVGFCVGCDYVWWPDYADFTNPVFCNFNRPQSGNHTVGLFAEGNLMCYLPDTVVDPGLGFTDGAFQTKNIQKLLTRGWQASDHQVNNAGGEALDYFLTIDNQFTTSGIPLAALSLRYNQNSLTTYLGDLPDIRLVNIANLNPGQEITYASETWKVFPLKRKGLRVNTCSGASPQPLVNTIEYGFAIKKIV